jgi:sugar phosphate isomerase/epimerase
MKTALCTLAFKDLSFEEILDVASEAGFDGVEPWGKPDHLPAVYDAATVQRAAAAVFERGLVVSQLGSYANPVSEAFAQEAADSILIANAFKTDTIRVWAGEHGSGEAEESEWERVTEGFRTYSDQAAEAGLRLAVEVHGNRLSDTTEGCLRLLEGVDRPNFRLNYQPTYPPDRALEELAKIAAFVVTVHVQNGGGLLSEGPLNYHDVVAILKGHGFDGFVEVEFVRKEDPLDALKLDAVYLRSLCES